MNNNKLPTPSAEQLAAWKQFAPEITELRKLHAALEYKLTDITNARNSQQSAYAGNVGDARQDLKRARELAGGILSQARGLLPFNFGSFETLEKELDALDPATNVPAAVQRADTAELAAALSRSAGSARPMTGAFLALGVVGLLLLAALASAQWWRLLAAPGSALIPTNAAVQPTPKADLEALRADLIALQSTVNGAASAEEVSTWLKKLAGLEARVATLEARSVDVVATDVTPEVTPDSPPPPLERLALGLQFVAAELASFGLPPLVLETADWTITGTDAMEPGSGAVWTLVLMVDGSETAGRFAPVKTILGEYLWVPDSDLSAGDHAVQWQGTNASGEKRLSDMQQISVAQPALASPLLLDAVFPCPKQSGEDETPLAGAAIKVVGRVPGDVRYAYVLRVDQLIFGFVFVREYNFGDGFTPISTGYYDLSEMELPVGCPL